MPNVPVATGTVPVGAIEPVVPCTASNMISQDLPTITHTVTATATLPPSYYPLPTVGCPDTGHVESNWDRTEHAEAIIALGVVVLNSCVYAVHCYSGTRLAYPEKIRHWRKLIKKFKEWEKTLPPGQRALIMGENPTLMKELNDELERLDGALEALEFNYERASTLQRWNSYSEVSQQYRDMEQAMGAMTEVWTSSTERYRQKHPFNGKDKYTVVRPQGCPPPAPPPPPPPSGPQGQFMEQINSLRAQITSRPLSAAQATYMNFMDNFWYYSRS